MNGAGAVAVWIVTAAQVAGTDADEVSEFTGTAQSFKFPFV